MEEKAERRMELRLQAQMGNVTVLLAVIARTLEKHPGGVVSFYPDANTRAECGVADKRVFVLVDTAEQVAVDVSERRDGPPTVIKAYYQWVHQNGVDLFGPLVEPEPALPTPDQEALIAWIIQNVSDNEAEEEWEGLLYNLVQLARGEPDRWNWNDDQRAEVDRLRRIYAPNQWLEDEKREYSYLIWECFGTE
jgi:hypothetical protein